MTSRPPSICDSCAHRTARNTCTAFPDDIPILIGLLGLRDHRFPFEGDHGIQWEQKPGADQELSDWLSYFAAANG